MGCNLTRHAGSTKPRPGKRVEDKAVRLETMPSANVERNSGVPEKIPIVPLGVV
jgi:hypothetical protein